MSTLPPKELLSLWSREELSVEMATGHVLQHLVAMQTTIETLKTAVSILQGQIDRLNAPPEGSPSGKGKKKPGSQR